MISEFAIYGVSAAVYALASIVLLVMTRGKPTNLRRYCYLLVGVVTVSAIGAVLTTFNAGFIELSSGVLEAPMLVDDFIAYSVLFGLATFCAGASRRMIALVVGLSVASRIAFEVVSVAGETLGVAVMAAIALIVVGSYLIRVYLMFGPIWATAKRQRNDRQLLYWKFRNLLLFLMGMLIVAALLMVFGFLGETAGIVVTQYIDVLLRVGFAGFLIANIEAFSETGRKMDSQPDFGTGGEQPA